jgi:quinol monooxygenase YgiN
MANRRRLVVSLLLVPALVPALVREAAAQDEGPVYVVTYFDVEPSAGADVAEALASRAAVARRAGGNLGFVALREIGRPDRFATLESWQDQAAFERANAAGADGLDARLAPWLDSPPDRRVCRGLVTGDRRDAGPGAVYVLTHVDVLPPSLDQGIENLRALATASRDEPANLRFDVLVTERRNHMTLVEVWDSADAQAAHAAEPHARAFRASLSGMLGALYDERLYRAL